MPCLKTVTKEGIVKGNDGSFVVYSAVSVVAIETSSSLCALETF